MKSLASLLLMSATFVGANAYAQEPPGGLAYRPVVGQISTRARVEVVRGIRAVKARGQVSVNEIGQPLASAVGDTVVLEVIRVQAVTVYVIGTYPSWGKSYNAAVNALDEATRGESEAVATQVAAHEVADEPGIAEASAVDVASTHLAITRTKRFSVWSMRLAPEKD